MKKYCIPLTAFLLPIAFLLLLLAGLARGAQGDLVIITDGNGTTSANRTTSPALPVNLGGTGGTNATQAWTNLGAARTISTTAPLSGGGNLTGNLTLSIGNATDSQPGIVSTANQYFSGIKRGEFRNIQSVYESLNWTADQWVQLGYFSAYLGINPLVLFVIGNSELNQRTSVSLLITSRGYGSLGFQGSYSTTSPSIKSLRLRTNNGGLTYYLDAQFVSTVSGSTGVVRVAGFSSAFAGGEWMTSCVVNPDATGFTIYSPYNLPTSTGTHSFSSGDMNVGGSIKTAGDAIINGTTILGDSPTDNTVINDDTPRFPNLTAATYEVDPGNRTRG
ncbi:MAG: hypothetical protein Fur0032_21030 [Terrimicrobiaceae bacterium]